MTKYFEDFVDSLPVVKRVYVRYMCPNCYTIIPNRERLADVNGFSEYAYRKYNDGETKLEFGFGHDCPNGCYRGPKSRDEMKVIRDRAEASRRVKCAPLYKYAFPNLDLRVPVDPSEIPDEPLDLDF